MPKGNSTYNPGDKTFTYHCPCMGEDLKIFNSKTGYDLFIRLHNKKCKVSLSDVIWAGETNVNGLNFNQNVHRQNQETINRTY